MQEVKVSERSLITEAIVDEKKRESIVEISSDNEFCSIYISKYRMNKDSQFGMKLLQMLEDFQLYYRHLPDGVDALNLVLHEDQLHQGIETDLIERISSELAAEKVTIKRNLALIMLVGGELTNNIDSISRAAKVLADEKVNIELIHMNQASSKINLLFGVKVDDERKALAALYREFFVE